MIPAKSSFHFLVVCVLFFISIVTQISAQTVQLNTAVMMVSPTVPEPMHTTVAKVLQEEISKRTTIRLGNAATWPKKTIPVVAIVLSADKEYIGRKVPVSGDANSPEYKKEGYRVTVESTDGQTVIWIIGADSRGVLFGAGRLLRTLEMGDKMLKLGNSINVASSPMYPIRGHQLGYRNTANSYDAWTVQQFDEYIRELAIFGSNAVEGIPFHEDDKGSPHFKIPAAEMRIRISEICRAYDMDYWVWTPVEFDLKDKERREAELRTHEAFYKACPRLDHIFFPGGDPGDNHPSDVLPFLEELQKRLTKYHPNAKMWISLQGFNTEQIDYFYQYLRNNNPAWLEGVVSGPSSPPIAETRYRLPARYKHREYPDITHSIRCEFPVEKWDQAYALTLGRESVNPRPYAFAKIHETYAPFTDGFVSYSDGNHDDINKVIWSMRAWDVKKDVNEILEEYCRFFFNPSVANTAAAGITGLEQNWNGSLAANGGVEALLSYWQKLEKENPGLKNNWRWQMLLLRANYDAYTRRRLLYEQKLEEKANMVLATASKVNTDSSMDAALAIVNIADKINIAPDLRKRIEELCAALYASTGLQTSVPKYKAKGYERGSVLDFVDYPLNNRWWLADEFAQMKGLANADEKLKRIQIIYAWENPGTGSYYDDISNVNKGARVKTISDDATDIAWWDNGKSRKRLSAQTFQRAPVLDYKNLDPGARYSIRVCGFGDALLRVDGIRLSPHIYNKDTDTFKEWIIPLSLTQDGYINVSFDLPEESHLNWRQNSRISDIWLLKQ